MNTGFMFFLQTIALFMTLGLLAAHAIPPAAGLVYIICLVAPIIID